jgi:hypothetical protein
VVPERLITFLDQQKIVVSWATPQLVSISISQLKLTIFLFIKLMFLFSFAFQDPFFSSFPDFQWFQSLITFLPLFFIFLNRVIDFSSHFVFFEGLEQSPGDFFFVIPRDSANLV